jgi:hypothetical protein
MEKRFYSKRDLWLTAFVWGMMIISLLPIITGFLNGSEPLGTAILIWILIISFIGWIWFGTYYVFREDYLLVRCGPIREKYYYKNISKVRHSHAPWSSTALSLDRLALYCNGHLKGYISPKEKEEFIKILAQKAPNAEIIL